MYYKKKDILTILLAVIFTIGLAALANAEARDYYAHDGIKVELGETEIALDLNNGTNDLYAYDFRTFKSIDTRDCMETDEVAVNDPYAWDGREAKPLTVTVCEADTEVELGEAAHDHESMTVAEGSDSTVYTCPMHPEIESHKPGECEKCGMKLVPKEEDES